ncbi:hypothetical protein MKX03_033414 [Papaver bracteatum]|nr:hypothetical protein MKX03_033414 [Papaver bracteatum]
MDATKTTLSLVGFLLFSSILLQSMNIVKASEHLCFASHQNWVDNTSSCAGILMRGKYSEDHYDCENWCLLFEDQCAQMNQDDDSEFYCACYSDCDPRETLAI